MKMFSATFNLIALVIIVFVMSAYMFAIKTFQRDFEQQRFNKAVEYSTEAAFRDSISTNDIGMDYSESSKVNINPARALDKFTTILCYNYNMDVCEQNKKTIEDSIGAIVLNSSTGFYITQLSYDSKEADVVKGDHSLKWSTKIPFMGKAYGKDCMYDVSSRKYTTTDMYGNYVSYKYVKDSEIEKEAINNINNQINNAIIQECNQKSLNGEPFDFKFYLPNVTTKSGVNPMNGPGIMVIMENGKFASSEKIKALSVSGFKVANKKYLIAYKKDKNLDGIGDANEKYYCYKGQLPINKINAIGGYFVDNYFETMKQAANNGYNPDYELLTLTITN